MKKCNRCGETKHLDDFYRDKSRKDGRKTICGDCTRSHAKIYRGNNRERLNAHSKKWHHENKNYIKKKSKEWRENNPEKLKAQKKRYRENNREKVALFNKKWRENNPRIRVYSEESKQKMKIKKREWKQNNKGLVRASGMKRYASKLKATPKWLNKASHNVIKQLYIDARELEKADGIPRHIDHIVPLQGENVCGLHVPWNLQILTAEENLKKSNKKLDINQYIC